MFQFALSRSLSVKKKCPLYLDISELNNGNVNSRNLELSIFKLNYKIKKNEDDFHLINKIGNYFFPPHHVSEQCFDYNPSILELNGTIFLDGYWQSEKYFSINSELIRKDFKFNTNYSTTTDEILKEIAKRKNTVSVHIRRGDYITSSKTNSIHGVCSIMYYTKAINILIKKLDNPYFYLFSDDTEWVKNNLFCELKKSCVVKHNIGTDNWQDMALMSTCEHHIIANSSFSWWGAWLNPSLVKTVIAPKRWFANNQLNMQTENLIPKNWIRL